jgi:hypothetical protein
VTVLAAVLSAAAAHAEEASWSGRLESTEDVHTCGAALVAPDMLVTAGHCLGPGGLGRTVRPPGDGPSAALRAIFRHPFYDELPPGRLRFRFDLTLAILDGITPTLRVHPVGPPPEPGETLTVETWLRDQPEPLRRACPVLEVIDGVATLDCAVTGGHSGGPVLRETADGPELVAILVGRQGGGDSVQALAVPLRPRLPTLLEAAGLN